VELSIRRINEALLGRSPSLARRVCVLVGRGSHDESATAEMYEFARLREQNDDAMKTEVAFLAMARPLLEEQLLKVAGQGYRHVIVQPHFLFHGELVDSITRQVAHMAAQHPEQEWIMTPPLADKPGVVGAATQLMQKVITDRCREAGIHVVAR
jgi:sirohydrochlorin cobaltochelatase